MTSKLQQIQEALTEPAALPPSTPESTAWTIEKARKVAEDFCGYDPDPRLLDALDWALDELETLRLKTGEWMSEAERTEEQLRAVVRHQQDFIAQQRAQLEAKR